MQVSEIMHKNISTVNIKESIRKVAELMRKEDIGAVPVMENEKAVGIVTDRDIVINCVAGGYDLEKSISLAMSDEIIFVKENQDLEEATRLMKEKQISRILVVNDQERPVGMISLKDLAQTQIDQKNAVTLEEIKKQ